MGRAAAVLAVGVASMLLVAPAAHAHNRVVSTTPSDGRTETNVPTEVVVTFDRTVLGLGTTVRVVGPDGDATLGEPAVRDETVTQELAGGPAGTYRVSWRVTSADGHPVSGSSTFVARAGTVRTNTRPLTIPSPSGSADATADESSSTPWPSILVAGALGAAAGTVLVLVRRRRGRGTS